MDVSMTVLRIINQCKSTIFRGENVLVIYLVERMC